MTEKVSGKNQVRKHGIYIAIQVGKKYMKQIHLFFLAKMKTKLGR